VATGGIVQFKITLGQDGEITTELLELQEPPVVNSQDLDNTNNTSATDSPIFKKITNFFIPTSLKLDTKILFQKIEQTPSELEPEKTNGTSETEAFPRTMAKNELVTYYFPAGFCEPLLFRLIRKDPTHQVIVKVALNPLSCHFEIQESN
jgi:hypothetical protein